MLITNYMCSIQNAKSVKIFFIHIKYTTQQTKKIHKDAKVLEPLIKKQYLPLRLRNRYINCKHSPHPPLLQILSLCLNLLPIFEADCSLQPALFPDLIFSEPQRSNSFPNFLHTHPLMPAFNYSGSQRSSPPNLLPPMHHFIAKSNSSRHSMGKQRLLQAGKQVA